MIDFWIFPLSTIWGAYQIIGFEALFVLHKKLYKVVQAVFTGLRPVFGPFLLSLVR